MSLPEELDFAADPSATPARFNRAMDYIVARFRALEAVTPDFSAAVEQLKAVGLDRLNDVLAPIFVNATDIADALETIQAQWVDSDIVGTMEAEVIAALRDGAPDEFNTLALMAAALINYRSKYLGPHASAPTVDDNGDPVAAGAMYFDTVLGKMRVYSGTTWNDAGSAVQGIMARQSFTATGGETSVTVSGGYDPGNLVVFLNGLALSPSDVTLTSGTSIGLVGALTAGDEVSWVKFTQLTLANVYVKSEVDAAIATAMALVYSKTEMDTTIANLRSAVSVSMSSGSVTLNAGQAAYGVIILTGTLTANRNVVFPVNGEWVVINRTSGAFTVTCKTASGTGVVVVQGRANQIVADGTNVVLQHTDFDSADLTGTPTATNPPSNDNSTRIATTAWAWSNIQALVAGCIAAVATAAGFSSSFSGNGYIKFPSWLGGLVIQWCGATGGAPTTVFWPITFPTNCLFACAQASSNSATTYGINLANNTTLGTTANPNSGGSGATISFNLLTIGN